ncbi:integrase [Geobacillus subterraneus]|uniref:Integrase n=2 Tax=Geobacillus TaxID=129337 RepID=A0ABN4NG39_9BACL|nr:MULTISPECIES: tyrosine-type recombinase/integrase [Geobacillus]AMX83598.1 integrase [Geobacillus subterraneus]KZS25685.1 integrase [Geobacillus subterraneus]OXB87831.1 integrase [Geobacillus uzenensis]
MSKTNISAKSTLIEAFNEYEKSQFWSKNTRRTYRKNVIYMSEYMLNQGLNPVLENIDYEFVKIWENDQRKQGYSPRTIKQHQATMQSMFTHYNRLGVINGNPFAALKITDSNKQKHHSRALNIIELYQVYKAAFELQERGVNVLVPTLIDMFTALRVTSLEKLTVRSVSTTMNGLVYEFDPKKDRVKEDKLLDQYLEEGDKHTDNSPNSKNKDFFIPLPPKLMKLLTQYIEHMEPNDALLYGLRGKPLINKQMNYIIDKVCEHLGWIKVEYEQPENKENHNHAKEKGRRNKIIRKTEKYFTPHGLRYTLSTLFHEMGVSDDAIRFLLGHSRYELGALQHYILSDAKYIKEIRAAQVIIETLFETTMELESNYNITLDLEEIFDEIPKVYSNQLKNKNYINLFKEHLVKYAFAALQQKILKESGNNHSDYFTFQAPELYNQIAMAQQGYFPHAPMPYQQTHGMHSMSYDLTHPVPLYPPTHIHMK